LSSLVSPCSCGACSTWDATNGRGQDRVRPSRGRARPEEPAAAAASPTATLPLAVRRAGSRSPAPPWSSWKL
jgi:hypothetical protein